MILNSHPQAIADVEIDTIKPSPENDDIYGAIDKKDIELVNLAISIRDNGILEPILVSNDNYIVSGHRRHAASKMIGLKTVKVRFVDEYRSLHNAVEWKRVLASYNVQRVKPMAVRMREAVLAVDPEVAHQQLLESRKVLDRNGPPKMAITGTKKRSEIGPNKLPMLNAAIKIIAEMHEFWPLTVRQVHYGLLNDPPLRNASKGKQRSVYLNNTKCYNDLCELLTRARLFGLVEWEAITDETRPTSGLRFSKDAAQFFDIESHNFLRGYRRDLLQSQSDHVELVIEKMTVGSIIEPIANKYCLPTTTGRGYCSIDPRYQIVQRYRQSGKDRLKLLIVSDFDPDGDEIAESFARSIRDDFGIGGVMASKILLRQDQVRAFGIPNNGLEAKESSSKFKKFVERYGSVDAYELEAVPPKLMQSTVTEAIESTLDLEALNRELALEKTDAAYLQTMKNHVTDSFTGMPRNGGAT